MAIRFNRRLANAGAHQRQPPFSCACAPTLRLGGCRCSFDKITRPAAATAFNGEERGRKREREVLSVRRSNTQPVNLASLGGLDPRMGRSLSPSAEGAPGICRAKINVGAK